MKIYNKLVLDMTTWEVIEEDSFEYDGPLALCGGSESTTQVYPSAQEQALQAAQLKAINEQQAESTALKPFLYSSMGLVQNDDGSLRKMTSDEYYNSLNETDKSAYTATQLQNERLIKALKGELPVSSALESDISDREATLRNTLAQKLGSNYETSTPGIQALSEFGKKADQLREASRNDEINSGTALSLNQMGFLDTTAKNTSSLYSNLPSRYGSQVSSIGTAMQPYQYYNGLNAQIAAQNTNSSNQYNAGLWQGIGSLAGAGLGAYGNYMGLTGLLTKR